MNTELMKLLEFWYIKKLDIFVSESSFQNFINLVGFDTEGVLDFATFFEYFEAGRYTVQLLKENNVLIIGETIRMLKTIIANVKQFLGERFLEMQNNLLEELKIQYQNEGLNPNYIEVIERRINEMNVGGRN